MAIRDIFRISRRTFFDPVGWVDYESLSNNTRTIYQTLKNQFTVQTPEREESFEAAMERMGVNEEEIKTAAQTYRFYGIFFGVIGVLLFLYAFYLLFRFFSIFEWLMAIALCALSFAQAFRYDFWSFQIRSRQLGATFQDWKNNLLGKGKQA